jgi:two-component system, sensor histidine kinase and response regulator
MELSDCSILVVDDTEANLDLVLGTLGELYDVAVAMDGATAIELVDVDPPHLILLDIMMPDMDGYEVCKRLKAEEKTKHIPIIFLTAMSKDMDEAEGLNLGAVDYITKPFNPDLLKARVKNQLELKLQRDELEKQNEILYENSQLKEDIERITRHDLKSPLNGIMNFPYLVLKNEHLTENEKSYLHKTIKLGRKMLNLINLSLDIYKMEQGTYTFEPGPVDIIPMINDILAENEIVIESNELIVKTFIGGKEVEESTAFTIQGEGLLCYSMLANIIKNAIEASDDEDQITIDLSHPGNKTIKVHNQGAVPEDIRETFFEKYSTSGKSTGTGLGTYSAKLMAETLGATISLKTSEKEGTAIIFEFPE